MRGIRRLTVRVSFCVRTAMTRFDDKLAATIAHARRHTLGDLVRRTASRAPDRTALIYRDAAGLCRVGRDDQPHRERAGAAWCREGRTDRVALAQQPRLRGYLPSPRAARRD